jgi:hypothetical protein
MRMRLLFTLISLGISFYYNKNTCNNAKEKTTKIDHSRKVTQNCNETRTSLCSQFLHSFLSALHFRIFVIADCLAFSTFFFLTQFIGTHRKQNGSLERRHEGQSLYSKSETTTEHV